jgi:hypothetical protein
MVTPRSLAMNLGNKRLQDRFDDPEMTGRNVGAKLAEKSTKDRRQFFDMFRNQIQGNNDPRRGRKQVLEEYKTGTQRRTTDPRQQYRRAPGSGLPAGWADQLRGQANVFPNQAVTDRPGGHMMPQNDPHGTQRFQESMLQGTGARRTGKDIVQRGGQTWQAQNLPTGGSQLMQRPEGWTPSPTAGQWLGGSFEPTREEMGMSSPQTAAEMARPRGNPMPTPFASGNPMTQRLVDQGIMSQGQHGQVGLNQYHPFWQNVQQQGEGSPWDYYAGMNPFGLNMANPPGQNLTRTPGSYGFSGMHQQWNPLDISNSQMGNMMNQFGLDPNTMNQMYQGMYGRPLYEGQNNPWAQNAINPLGQGRQAAQRWQAPQPLNAPR